MIPSPTYESFIPIRLWTNSIPSASTSRPSSTATRPAPEQEPREDVQEERHQHARDDARHPPRERVPPDRRRRRPARRRRRPGAAARSADGYSWFSSRHDRRGRERQPRVGVDRVGVGLDHVDRRVARSGPPRRGPTVLAGRGALDVDRRGRRRRRPGRRSSRAASAIWSMPAGPRRLRDDRPDAWALGRLDGDVDRVVLDVRDARRRRAHGPPTSMASSTTPSVRVDDSHPVVRRRRDPALEAVA